MRKQKIAIPDFLGGNKYDSILDEARYIHLYSPIDNELAKEINTKLMGMAIESARKPIFLEINSPGGSVADGIAIMNTILQLPAPVITIINGEAASMAGFIAVVGDKRYITPNSYFMAHIMYDEVGGNPYTIKDRGAYLIKLEDNLNAIFKEKTKLSDEEFDKMLRGELWLDADQCVEKGIVNDIFRTPLRTLSRKKRKK